MSRRASPYRLVGEPSLLPPRLYEERNLQRAVHQYLRMALPPDAVHFSIPNGLMRSKKAGAAAVGEGLLAGVPDLEIVWRGRAFFIELKAPRGVVSAAQRETQRRLIYAGAEVMVCKSVEQVEAGLREAGMRLRGQVAA
jgi:VRR-NUC domain